MKKLLIVLGVLVALLVVGYFVVTSSGFLKAVVLPKVGEALNSRVEADRIALSPLSSVEIRGLKVTPNGAETLATVETARVRYDLFAILGGRIVLHEIALGSPVVTVVQKADGTGNLDPILNKAGGGTTGTGGGTPSPAGKPIQLDLKTLKIENGSLAYRADAKDGSKTVADVKGLNFSADNIKNGGQGGINVNAAWAFRQTPSGAGATNNGMQGSLQGAYTVELTPDLAPARVNGKSEAQVQSGEGSFREFQGFSTTLTADLSPTELKQLILGFSRQGAALGSISARGPLDVTKKEAKLQLDVQAIDKNVLNLVGAAYGLDFTTTRFDSTNVIEVTAGGQKVAVAGGVTGTQVSVKKGDLVLPALNLKDVYDLAVDVGGQSATIKTFALNASQGGREVLRGTLSQPMQISWASNAPALPDASMDLALMDVRLADWSALVGAPLAGTFQAAARLGVQGSGKDLGFDGTAAMSGFSGTFASNEVKNLGFKASLKGAVATFADASKRRLKLNTVITDLTGQAAVVSFDRYGVEAKADIGLPENAVVIDLADVSLKGGGVDGGTVSLKGRWDTARMAGDLNLSARDVNQDGLRPFLQAALGDKQLRSVRLSSDLSLKMDPSAETAVKANASVTNLVVHDPAGVVPESPLAAGLVLDASGSSSKLTLRQAEVRLTPTARAKNTLAMTGDLDFSKTNALRGALKVAAESLDITPYYELFAGAPKPGGPTPPTSPTPTPAPPGPQREPDPIPLPVEHLTIDVNVGKFFLREVAAENFVAGVKIEGSRVEIQPFQLALNGAPIKAGMKLNLGVPGYEYDMNLTADRVPVRPFANSFVPTLKDRIEGSILAGVDIKGAGVTGTSLQKHLAGGMTFSVTNANLKLIPAGTQKQGVLSILTGLLATALNIREIKDHPIMDIAAEAKMGGGRIDLTRFAARSQSVAFSSEGSIPIADDLMQSPLKLPVQVSLNRSLAEKARLVSTNTPTNAVYVALPPIASVKGTLGAPAPEIDKVQTAALAARGIAGLVGGDTGALLGAAADLVTGKGGTNAAANLIQGIGGLLKSGSATNTNAAPAKNPLGGVLKGILEPKKP